MPDHTEQYILQKTTLPDSYENPAISKPIDATGLDPNISEDESVSLWKLEQDAIFVFPPSVILTPEQLVAIEFYKQKAITNFLRAELSELLKIVSKSDSKEQINKALEQIVHLHAIDLKYFNKR